MRTIRRSQESNWSPVPIAAQCPECGHKATLDKCNSLPHDVDFGEKQGAAIRICPNQDCRSLIFVIRNDYGRVLRIYPAARVDFDRTSVPERIANHLDQAIICHSEECYTAAAIMVRRTLEELCEDKRAAGSNLKERIASLRQSVVLPAELFEAMDELRLLGNDAAHIEAKAFNQVGEEEVRTGIDLAKEILRACYQLGDLVARMKALKKPTA